MVEYRCSKCQRIVVVSNGDKPCCPDHGDGPHMKETGNKPLPKDLRMTDKR